MSTIISKPSAYNFTGNIADIVIRSSADVSFALSAGGVVKLRELYTPLAGVVTIRLQEIMELVALDGSFEPGSVSLPQYSYVVDTLPVETFYCIKGGHGADTDAATFMRSNWLSWRPQSCLTAYHTPHRLCYATMAAGCSVFVKAYFNDDTNQQITLITLGVNALHTIDVSYGTVRGLFVKQPLFYDVWAEGDTFKSYPQRFQLINNDTYNADVFMWRNSLGGVDTVMFGGERVEKNEIQSLAGMFGRSELEYGIDSKKLFTKYTGYVADNNTRLWVLDFFNSRCRYHVDGGHLRRIVVSKPKLESTRGELAGYEFTFAYAKQSPYLNLPRVDVPELLEITDPVDKELFFLAPRLNQFERAMFDDGDILIPVQYAAAGRWLSLPLADILANAGGGGGGGVNNIRGDLPIRVTRNGYSYTVSHMPPERDTEAEDFNRYDNLDATGHVVRDYHPHGGRVEVPFTALSVHSDEVTSHEFTPAMIGYGNGMITDPESGQAHLWTDHLHARQSFETLEMRYRKMLVSGEELVVNNGGVVKMVYPVGWGLLVANGRPVVTQDGKYISVPNFKSQGGNPMLTFELKGEHGIDYQMFDTDDILRYTWRDTETGLKGASGYLVVRKALEEFLYVAEVVDGSPEWLCEGMSLALWGNLTNVDRQGFLVLSSRERTMTVYDGVNSTTMSAANVKAILGRLEGIVDPAFGTLKGSGLYSQNCYLKGTFMLRSGNTVEQELSTQFTATTGLIEGVVKQVDAVDGKVTKQETRITQTEKDVTLKASKDGLVAQINVSPEAIKIKAEKIELDGLVKATDLLVNGKIRADKINTDSLVAKQIDTRVDGKSGIVARRGLNSVFEIYDVNGNLSAVFQRSGVVGLAFYYDRNSVTTFNQSGIHIWRDDVIMSYSEDGFICSRPDIYGVIKPSVTINEQGITLPPNAKMNMPGVLAAGRVNGSSGAIGSNRWGYKSCGATKYNGQAGRYKITHNIGHMSYYVTANIVYTSWCGQCVILEKQNNYIVIGVADVQSNFRDGDIEFIICGKN